MTALESSHAPSRALVALAALSLGTFGIGTTEFAPMGLLPVIALGVDVSIPTAGLLISAYAVGVLLSTPLVTLGLANRPPKRALLMLMGLFTLGNLMAAVAPGYACLVLARVVTSFSHGAFMGIGAVVAVSLVPINQQARAVAIFFMGLTLANILGVPGATWLGHAVGWRTAFLATALLGLLTAITLHMCLPSSTRNHTPNWRKELRVLKRPSVLTAMLTTVLSATAMFTVYTYVAPILAEIAGVSGYLLTLDLALIGCGFLAGNLLSARLADGSPGTCLMSALVALTVISALLPWLATSRVSSAVFLFLWGVAAFALVSPLQTKVMHAAADAPHLASSMNIAAFNLGNAIGAAIGGWVVSTGSMYSTVTTVAALIAGLTCVLVAYDTWINLPASPLKPYDTTSAGRRPWK